MIRELHCDFESRSPVSLRQTDDNYVGLYNYVFHPQTEPLFLWYKTLKGEYRCVKFYLGERIEDHPELLDALLDPGVQIVAFNSAFERYMFKRLGCSIAPARFTDPQVGGRYLSLPASLEVQCTVLQVPLHLAKIKGDDYIDLFCKQVVTKATKRKPNPRAPYYNDWNSHPKEWEKFLEYGRMDVISEGELLRRIRVLGGLPLPESEQKLWLLDQQVNDRGMPTDRGFVEKMYRLALRAKAEKKAEFEKLTGVKNANSPKQVKVWAVTQGYPYPSLNKDVVTSALKDPTLKLTPLCREALKLRREAASTSYTKLPTILECLAPDNMLHGQFVFMGSSRCGRWSGNAVQLHNFPRPNVIEKKDEQGNVTARYDFEDQKVVKEARTLVYAENYEAMRDKYGSVLLVVKNLLRTVFVAP